MTPPARLQLRLRADVAELVDAHGSGPCARKGVEVQVLSSALLRATRSTIRRDCAASYEHDDASISPSSLLWRRRPRHRGCASTTRRSTPASAGALAHVVVTLDGPRWPAPRTSAAGADRRGADALRRPRSTRPSRRPGPLALPPRRERHVGHPAGAPSSHASRRLPGVQGLRAVTYRTLGGPGGWHDRRADPSGARRSQTPAPG